MAETPTRVDVHLWQCHLQQHQGYVHRNHWRSVTRGLDDAKSVGPMHEVRSADATNRAYWTEKQRAKNTDGDKRSGVSTEELD